MNIRLALVSFLVFFCSAFSSIAQEKFKEIDIETFSIMSVEQPGIILDARTEQEFNNGHIPGSININYYAEDAAAKMLALEKDKPLYVYCQAGGRAKKACDFLIDSGFKNVFHIKGDMMGWEKAGKEISKISNE